MCDYSLMAIPNRLAVCGDELIAHRFGEGSIGLASASDLQVKSDCPEVPSRGFWSKLKSFFDPPDAQSIPAVCIPPGARLLVRDIPPRLQREYGFPEETEAVFTQLSAAVNTFRDAVRFPGGVEVLLQRFHEGQRVRVLELSLDEMETYPTEDRRVRV